MREVHDGKDRRHSSRVYFERSGLPGERRGVSEGRRAYRQRVDPDIGSPPRDPVQRWRGYVLFLIIIIFIIIPTSHLSFLCDEE